MRAAPASLCGESAKTLLATMDSFKSYQCRSYCAMLRNRQEDVQHNIAHHMSLTMQLSVVCMAWCAHDTHVLDISPAAEAYLALLL